MDISKQGFLEFCIAQGDEIIEHNSGMSYEESAWSNCAVGAYYTHLTGDRLTIDNVGDHDGPDYFPEQLGELIGDSVFSALSGSEIHTYPELVAELQETAGERHERELMADPRNVR